MPAQDVAGDALVRITVDAVRLRLGRVLLAGLEERLEDGVAILEVVVHDVDKVPGVHDLGDELVRRRVGAVDLRPLRAELVGLVL